MRTTARVTGVVVGLLLAGCYGLRGNSGGGTASFDGTRVVSPDDVAVPYGYRIDVVATGFTYPTGVTFDESGTPYVVESGYAYGEDWTEPRLVRVEDGTLVTVARGGRNGPWTGATFHAGAFYVAEGGALEGGRILRIDRDGATRVLVQGLPSMGDHHTNGPIVGPDGMLWFGQGTATNSAVVGEDNAQFGWLARHPQFHDVPGEDVVLTGEDFESDDPLHGGRAVTGPFLPFGTPAQPGQVVRGQVPCSGSVMKIPLEGGRPTLVAWGFRNPFGLALGPDGAVYVTDNGYDDRGSRPVWGTGDILWKLREGAWYGWPDFSAGLPLTLEVFHAPGGPTLRPVMEHRREPPRPVAVLGVHSSADGFDFSRNPEFGHVGDAFVALFGDQSPATGKLLNPVGFKVVRVNVANGVIEDFAVNRGDQNGPATRIGNGGLERPLAARFDPDGTALYVVDFGVLTQTAESAQPRRGTGVLWRITRAR